LVDVQGAAGGLASSGSSIAGKGGRVQATVAVTPGQSVYFYVGGSGGNSTTTVPGAGGFNGGGTGAIYSGNMEVEEEVVLLILELEEAI